MRTPDPVLAIPLSLLAGLLLTLAPLVPELAWWRPEWLFILLVFWVFNQPDSVGIWTAFLLGLVMDLVMGTRFGIYPAAFVVAAWLARVILLRWRVLTWTNTGIALTGLTFVALAIRYLLELALGNPPVTAYYWLPVISNAVCWLPVQALLQRWGRY
ncbi:rod shape-determining protein MreD [Fluviicoccus keumensis]|uniref:Rod shape-determining protein MreD n=1 Tax=Fluviicoccus keumensis TaxID=1435465 RepID=A0A4Q7Z540_9GAMM|nr:rod shape-determining protein MreD [Fluviicoccus keumensis]RZU44921.1 rod shape-determining protein MreD [Fluviicoccus keumensis]